MESLFEEIIAGHWNTPLVWRKKKIDIQIQKAQKVSNKMNLRRLTGRYILIKSPKVKGKETILKALREKK